MLPIRNSLSPLLGLCLFLWAFNVSFSLGQQNSSSDHLKDTGELGRATYSSACAGCHGLDGRGSDKAVDISGSDNVRRLLRCSTVRHYFERHTWNRHAGVSQPECKAEPRRSGLPAVTPRQDCYPNPAWRCKPRERNVLRQRRMLELPHDFRATGDFLAPIFRATGLPRQPRKSATRSSGHGECRPKAIERPCSLLPMGIDSRA